MPRTRVAHPAPQPEPQVTAAALSPFALFAPLVVVVAALLIFGHHSIEQWVIVAVVFLGFPLAVLALRRRAAHLPRNGPSANR